MKMSGKTIHRVRYAVVGLGHIAQMAVLPAFAHARKNSVLTALVRSGRIGAPKIFTSTFCQRVKPGDIRTRKDLGGGTLYDIGVYCINAARYLFGAEPTQVWACSVNGAPGRLPQVDDSTAAVLRFDGGRLA